MSEPTSIQKIPVWRIWDNPIFRRYCRSRLRPRDSLVAAVLTLTVTIFIFAMSRSIGLHRASLSVEDAERGAIIPLLVWQAVLLFVFGTAQVAGGMTGERDEGVIDYQRLVPMQPLAKVLGYLFGLPIREWAMFLTTLPFTAWAIWKGNVQPDTWMPLYMVLITSTWLYHLTGLTTGTVVKNRRWAFLISMALVFSLYTVVPQAARFGLVVFKYLAISPVFMESLPGLLPKTQAAVVEVTQRLAPTPKFFNLDFSESVFTVFSQAGLILTFLVMLCRRWRRNESLLLGKIWAAGLYIWIQLLLLGNALPLVESGQLFPSRGLLDIGSASAPSAYEVVVMSGLYGTVSLLLVCIFANMITASQELQLRGWRRARKQGESKIPLFSDASTAVWAVLTMSIAGAIGWFIFTQSVIESVWFPGQVVPLHVALLFLLAMLSACMGFHALLESRGRRFAMLTVMFVGLIPVLTGVVMGTISDRMLPAATWITGISPISAPIYASCSLLQVSELPETVARAVPRAYAFWQLVMALAALWLITDLRQRRRKMAQRLLSGED